MSTTTTRRAAKVAAAAVLALALLGLANAAGQWQPRQEATASQEASDVRDEGADTWCDRVDWSAVDDDGHVFVPVDADEDGQIDCHSDIELGA